MVILMKDLKSYSFPQPIILLLEKGRYNIMILILFVPLSMI